MNLLSIPFMIVVLVLINEVRNYRLLRKSIFLYECCNVKFYRYRGKKDDDNAITITSFFGNGIVLLSDSVSNSVIYHELGHLRQKKELYLFLITFAAAFAIAFSYDVVLLILLLLVYKMFFAHLEREADLYAYTIHNVKYNTQKATRPERKIARLKAWIFDLHPPDWVRTREEYYDRRKNIICLFLEDVF